jgi:hypothetical protein
MCTAKIAAAKQLRRPSRRRVLRPLQGRLRGRQHERASPTQLRRRRTRAGPRRRSQGMATVGVQNCTSYHLCNANAGGAATHCKHAAATAECTPAP